METRLGERMLYGSATHWKKFGCHKPDGGYLILLGEKTEVYHYAGEVEKDS